MEIFNWIANLFILGIGTFFLAFGLFIISVIIVSILDEWRK